MIFEIILACALSTCLFAALIIYIAKHPHKRTLPLNIAFIIMFFGGMLIYGYCNYERTLSKNVSIGDKNFE